MQLGYHVILSDTDVAVLDNPFRFLHRDCDLEGSTDGWNTRTAYGWSSQGKHKPKFDPWCLFFQFSFFSPPPPFLFSWLLFRP